MFTLNVKTAEEIQQKKADDYRAKMDAITVSRFQAKAALDDAGLLDAIEGYMSGDNVSRRVKLAWKEASFSRGSKMVQDVAGAFDLTTEQLDDLFIAAQEIIA